jgi:peptidoglycan/LPS O-acetylase OafA/YrhL
MADQSASIGVATAIRAPSLTTTLTRIKPKEIGALTGLRGAAALWVVIFHLASEVGAVAGPAAGTFAQAGYVGVDLFFVLSGFVIADNYRHFFEPWDRDKYWRFQLVRLGRIYPVHFVMLLATIAIVGVATAAGFQRTTAGVDYSLGSFFANVLLVQAWGFPQYSWNWVAWTISAEWFAYLLFPFAAYFVFSHLTGRNVRLVVIIAMYTFMLAISTWVGPDRTELALVRVTAGFTAGVMVWLRARDRPPSETTSRIAASIAIAGIVTTIVAMSVVGAIGGFWPAPWFALLVFGVSRDRGAIARVLRSSPGIFFGRISYSLYMVHAWVIVLVRVAVSARLGPSNSDIIVLVSAPALSIVAATIMFFVIEEPFRKMSRAVARRQEL